MPGEVIVRQWERSAEMFVVESGEVSVDMGGQIVARLGTGKCFGEMAVMTGDPRNATVRTVTHCKLLVINDGAMRTVLAATPQLAEAFSRLIADRLAAVAAGDTTAEAPVSSVEEMSVHILGRIRRFFSL
jgi:CRP-like cAMP-binding protein